MGRFILTALVTIICISLAGAAFSTDLFTDIPSSHWAYRSARLLVEKGIMKCSPEGLFEGGGPLTRYHLASSLALTMETIREGTLKFSAEDTALLERLSVEFGDELALMGIRVTELKNAIDGARDDLAVTRSALPRGAGEKTPHRNIAITGDAWFHYDILEYENDATSDDQQSFYRLGLNFDIPIDANTRSFLRLVNDDLAGARFGEDTMTVSPGIDQAYIDVTDLICRFDVRAGRQFVKLGHGLALNDKLDALVFSGPAGRFDLSLVTADQADDGLNENGFSLAGLDAGYRFGGHQADIYCLMASDVDNIEAVSWGFALSGLVFDEIVILKNVHYKLEYSRYDPDTDTVAEGSAWLLGIDGRLSRRVGLTAGFGWGDEEFEPIGIHYWRRPYDLYGKMASGPLPEGYTLATGSLSGIEDFFVRLNITLSEKIGAFLLQEKVAAHNNSPDILNARDYKRMGVGFDYRYAPDTTLGIRYDIVKYDDSIFNEGTPDAGGWDRFRLEVQVRF